MKNILEALEQQSKLSKEDWQEKIESLNKLIMTINKNSNDDIIKSNFENTQKNEIDQIINKFDTMKLYEIYEEIICSPFKKKINNLNKKIIEWNPRIIVEDLDEKIREKEDRNFIEYKIENNLIYGDIIR